MSSSVAQSSVQQGKLMVHVAENGHTIEIDCDESTTVEAVMQDIESESGINFNDQLVLCLDMKLEVQRPLSVYKLPSSDREVFIFNKARLQTNSLPPPPEPIDLTGIAYPQPPPSSQNPHPLDNASDPALKALPSYERQFRYHYQFGQTIYSHSLENYKICGRLLQEVKVQERALEVARGNLDQYYRVINQNYLDFMKRFSQQHRVHSDLLVNFGRDLERLGSIKLPPALQKDTCKCLLDFVKEENLRKSAENCNSSHRQFENKVSQFKQTFNEVKHKVEELNSIGVSMSIKNLEIMIKDHQQYINEQKSIMQSLSKDVATVKKLVDDCLSGQLSSSIRPHDAVSALGPMYDVHDKNHLPRMQACDHSISELLEICKNKKTEMSTFLHNYMQKVAYVSYIIKDAKLQFPVFREAMVRQDDVFADLKLVRGIGPAYRACLAEIVRRKESMKLYMGKAGQLAERLAAERELEIRRREEFQKTHGSYIPRNIIESMGLCDIPSHCDVNIAPFDTMLLNVDISHLDCLAPEYLTGLSLKMERHGSFRSSLSMSNESPKLAEVQESEKYETEEPLEVSELAQIAGTSKIEVENTKLKAELASAIALICSLCPEVDYEPLDDSKVDSLLKNAAKKTAEAFQLKDEYEKHLQSMLKATKMQCVAYEERIKELEQRLSDQYFEGQKLSSSKETAKFPHLAAEPDGSEQEVSDGLETQLPCKSTTEPMDEVSCISSSFDVKLGFLSQQHGKVREGLDINMMDSSGMINPQLDLSMVENREEHLVGDKVSKDKNVGQLGMSMTNSSTAESMPEPLNAPPCDATIEASSDSKIGADMLLELQTALEGKSNLLSETEVKLKTALEEVSMLKRELEASRKLLDESQLNCAHLENCLHEAREEAQTHLCAADRRASEYSALRTSSVRMHGLFERLRSCIYAPGGVAGFAESLRALAQSLTNSINEDEDDGTAEFRKCIRVLADRVSFLSRHRGELLDKYPKVEAANRQLREELEDKKELVKTLYTKHQLEKQANKEKISFGRLEVHEIAAFVLNSARHYEAINRNGLNYYLSAESVALFTDHLPSRPNYIVGQIVHIERQTVKPLPPSTRAERGRTNQMDHLTSDLGNDGLSLNAGATSTPFGLPVGCEYFIVTVAMLPDTAIHSPPPS